MNGILRRPIVWMGLVVALSSASVQANEPSFSLADYIHAPTQAPSPSSIQCDDCDFDCDRVDSRRLSNGCGPTWNVYVGAVFLTRDRPDAGIIIGANPPNGTSFSRGSDFDFNTKAGIDVLLSRRFANGDQLEGRYFGIDSNNATQQIITPGNFIGTGFVGPGGTAVNGNYGARLQSAEINWRRPLWERLTVLAGFRYFGLDDTLNYTLNTTVAGGQYRNENDLYGGQIGSDWSLLNPGRPLELHVIGKAGLYGNASNGTFRTDSPVGNPIQNFGRDESSPAFAGDLQLVGAYRFSRHIGLRGGYQMLWLDNVALAGDNASASQLNPSSLNNHIDDGGHVFYHGAMVGAEFMW